MSRINIGLFGGTFDPPHVVHLILASEAAYQFDLSRLHWVLTPEPPHKRGQTLAALEHRLAMTERAIANNPSFDLSRLELDRPGPHYSVDTVRLLAEREPQADIFLLIGGDSLDDLPGWHSAPDLVARVHKICVMRRPGSSPDLAALERRIPGLSQKVSYIETLLHDLSSSEVRRRVAAGEPFRYFLLPSVYEYIEANRLYRAGA